MLRIQPLLDTPIVSIHRTEHPPETLTFESVEEMELDHAICFVEEGGFQLGVGEHEWALGEGDLFVSRPRAMYRFTHMRDVKPDVCLVVSLASSFDEHCDRELRFPHVVRLRTNRLGFLQFRLGAIVDAGDALAAECWVTEIMAALAAASSERGRPYRSAQIRWYAERVEAARCTLTGAFHEQHSLATLATEVGMSPFQFARIFRQLLGVPPHRYLLNVRLEHARRLLLDGVSVTDACYDCGFSNLSHFIRTFVRRFGCTPSRLRRGAWMTGDGGSGKRTFSQPC